MRRSLQTGRASSNAVLGLASLGLIAIPLASLTADLVILPEETFHGAFVGGPTGKPSDTTLNNAVQPSLLTAGRSFDVPSGSKPSPLFGAQPFTQRMLLLEEFGTKPIQSGGGGAAKVLSQPNSNRHCIEGRDVDSFLRQPMYPAPSRTSNTIDRNPLRPVIESTLARECETAPCEGRPGGEDFAHQRWAEFQPQVFVESALAGSHPNSGMRDAKQRHGYAVGEFAPGGLYHNTAGAPGFDGTTAGIRIKLHPNMPEQDPLAVWTFDGTLPLKLLQARYGETILFRNHNMLPVDPSANRGFGLHTITTHEHNGHNPAESDGFANAFFFPGQYYDYR